VQSKDDLLEWWVGIFFWGGVVIVGLGGLEFAIFLA
jgi:hypothetical protein